ncbi:MAG: T9SS type A sorting domain-containing protein [Bacteroidota bacterium]
MKAALNPASPDFASYLPTYFGDVLFWNNSTGIVMNNVSSFGNDIDLVAGTNLGGPGFIGGAIAQGANKTAGPGDPVANAPVFLLDANGSAVAHTTSDANGEYTFSNIALGDYQVFVELLNKTSVPYNVTLNAEEPMFTLINFVVTESTVEPAEPNSVNTLFADGSSVRLYPNPVAGDLFLELNLTEAAVVDLAITNLVGQTLQQQRVSAGQGIQQVTIDARSYPAGTYLLTLRSAQGISTYKWIRQ